MRETCKAEDSPAPCPRGLPVSTQPQQKQVCLCSDQQVFILLLPEFRLQKMEGKRAKPALLCPLALFVFPARSWPMGGVPVPPETSRP